MMRRRPIALLGACGVVAASMIVVLTFVPGHQVSNTFANISNGLNPSGVGSDSSSYGGSGLTQAPAIAGAQAAVPVAQPQLNSSTNSNPNSNLALGTPPGNIERTVDASYVVPHKQFDDAFNQVISHAVNDEGGFVVSTSTTPDSSGRMVAGTVVVKVPTAKLSAFLSALPNGMFTPSSINFATIDHTSEYIDDQARLDEAQQELDALKRALAATSDAGTIASLTQQISDAQQNLEKQQATFAVVQQAVALSTATVHIKESGAVAASTPAEQPVLAKSTQGALNNDLWIASGLIYAVLTGLPLLVLLLVLALSRRRIMRAARSVIS